MTEREVAFCESKREEYIQIIYSKYRGHSKEKRNKLFTTLESWGKVLLMQYYGNPSRDDITQKEQ
ncbi:hypothetical protein [Peribacillus frigoritolerans]|uniref:Uncharacterized protein n=1 Tax=Peribacillus castrilensis TaxID=2897690 RepID=A0AAW9NML5_9BACI|nr:hypothetical protein [Peribacillus castrilensis]